MGQQQFETPERNAPPRVESRTHFLPVQTSTPLAEAELSRPEPYPLTHFKSLCQKATFFIHSNRREIEMMLKDTSLSLSESLPDWATTAELVDYLGKTVNSVEGMEYQKKLVTLFRLLLRGGLSTASAFECEQLFLAKVEPSLVEKLLPTEINDEMAKLTDPKLKQKVLLLQNELQSQKIGEDHIQSGLEIGVGTVVGFILPSILNASMDSFSLFRATVIGVAAGLITGKLAKNANREDRLLGRLKRFQKNLEYEVSLTSHAVSKDGGRTHDQTKIAFSLVSQMVDQRFFACSLEEVPGNTQDELFASTDTIVKAFHAATDFIESGCASFGSPQYDIFSQAFSTRFRRVSGFEDVGLSKEEAYMVIAVLNTAKEAALSQEVEQKIGPKESSRNLLLRPSKIESR